jgi:SAM-dependent methyltransferase
MHDSKGHRLRTWYSDSAVVTRLVESTKNVGLWRSEAALVERFFVPGGCVLDLGCGAGRAAIGMARLGFEVHGVDQSEEMIEAARQVADEFGVSARFEVGDALEIPYPDDYFDGVVFAYSGLMGIIPRQRRHLALLEIKRVLKSDGRFVFSGHDRDGNADWYRRWHTDGDLDPGDVLLQEDGRTLIVHCPRREDVLEELDEAGFVALYDAWRGDLPPEPEPVRESSLDCRLWVAAPSYARASGRDEAAG